MRMQYGNKRKASIINLDIVSHSLSSRKGDTLSGNEKKNVHIVIYRPFAEGCGPPTHGHYGVIE